MQERQECFSPSLCLRLKSRRTANVVPLFAHKSDAVWRVAKYRVKLRPLLFGRFFCPSNEFRVVNRVVPISHTCLRSYEVYSSLTLPFAILINGLLEVGACGFV